MSTGDQDPEKAAGPRGNGRAVVLTIALGVAGALACGAGLAHLARSQPPAPAATAPAKPPPTPLAVVEGEMVKVPGGALELGSADGADDEKPVTQVSLKPFEIDRTEVTVAAYARCVTAGKCSAPDTGMYCNWKKAGNEAHPINCVDWKQATDYCAFAGKRLPTEEEWELAARGADGRKFPWKDGEPGPRACWNGDDNDRGRGERQGTCPVASYPAGASPSGALDMAGNVWEWTATPYCPYGQKECGADKRVIRGGGWNNLVPAYLSAHNRAKEAPRSRPDNVGVRCAKDPP